MVLNESKSVVIHMLSNNLHRLLKLKSWASRNVFISVTYLFFLPHRPWNGYPNGCGRCVCWFRPRSHSKISSGKKFGDLFVFHCFSFYGSPDQQCNDIHCDSPFPIRFPQNVNQDKSPPYFRGQVYAVVWSTSELLVDNHNSQPSKGQTANILILQSHSCRML